ncbi:hypothetical protein CC78DRAFT_544961 [Lojkania enalia]|uniref:Uncharacterized protein n=1 Tax=Lojkania enalia TaxID=147567 RepID=A0A9P4N2H0_9PLEO|nr:hypothetical protein CC78DRAFT_544961 [Didymosphaeria enalia]
MEKRHSSPSPRASSPRPKTHRKRSNSIPIMEALGCSTAEAKLILAEGRAAVRSRGPSVPNRGRRNRSDHDTTTYRPKDHIRYLYQASGAAGLHNEQWAVTDNRSTCHARIPSNTTDGSTSTVVAPVQVPIGELSSPTTYPSNQLGDYSANLAKFTQSQLKSIPSYKGVPSPISPRSCPDFTFPASPRSPAKFTKRPVEMPFILQIPPIRPPLRSAFSAWSSTDDETDDEVPPIPSIDVPRTAAKTSNETPSILSYYENSSNGSFLVSSAPSDNGEQLSEPQGFSFPAPPAHKNISYKSQHISLEDEDISFTTSAHPQLTASSAPSFSSSSTNSYFEYKAPTGMKPQIKNRILATVSPHLNSHKVLTAISPFEGQAITNVHDVLIESQKRVIVEGLSFDLVRDINIPDGGMHRVPTPC